MVFFIGCILKTSLLKYDKFCIKKDKYAFYHSVLYIKKIKYDLFIICSACLSENPYIYNKQVKISFPQFIHVIHKTLTGRIMWKSF